MKKIFLFLIVSIFVVNAKAQVLIGGVTEPEWASILELRSDTLGFLPPRVNLLGPGRAAPLNRHLAGNVVYNKTATDSLRVGLYFNDGTRWVPLFTSKTIQEYWFYMPSIPIQVANIDLVAGKTVDLYYEYKKQLNTAGGLVKASAGAPTQVLKKVPEALDFWYYVTGYDDSVFDAITITNDGKMNYKIKPTAVPTDSTYLNIVFVEKQ